MINIIKTCLENKTDKQMLYYIGGSRIVLEPHKPVIIEGDIFSREKKQEGSTESLLVNVYNGNIDFTLSIDNDFVTTVKRENIVDLPQRSKSRLINKSVKNEPQKTESVKSVIAVEAKPEVKKEPEKVEVTIEEPKKEETKEASLETVVIEDTKPKTKKNNKG